MGPSGQLVVIGIIFIVQQIDSSQYPPPTSTFCHKQSLSQFYQCVNPDIIPRPLQSINHTHNKGVAKPSERLKYPRQD